MYYWYKRIHENSLLRLMQEDQTSLAGCNNGVIPNDLKEILSVSDNPPIGWTLPIADKWNKEDYSLIVDIKPKADEVFLCELDSVFGYSFEGWSPVMLRLKLLYNETTKEELDKTNFVYPEDTEVIYTMYYLYGSIRDGKLTGTWNPPYGTITALLFWPEAMTYFFDQVKKFDPHFLNANVKQLESLRLE